jgi:hypothetical protein
MSDRWNHPMWEYADDEIQSWDAGDGTPSEAELQELELRLNFAFPPEYHRFQRRYGATMVAVREDVWPRPVRHQPGPYWTFLYGFVVLGLGQDAPDWLDIRAVTASFHEEFPEARELVPFFSYPDDRDFRCFHRDGSVWFWSHDTPDKAELREVNFDDFLIEQMKKLLRGKESVWDARLEYGDDWRFHAKYRERD